MGSGLIAGAVFFVLELIFAASSSPDGMFGPLRMIAAIVMGESILRAGTPTGIAVFLIATFVHFMLSITYTGILFAMVQGMRSRGAVVMAGLAFGLVLYLINFYAFSEIFFWFANSRNWMNLTSHLAFGLTAALCISRMYISRVEEEAIESKAEEKKKTVVKEREEEMVE